MKTIIFPSEFVDNKGGVPQSTISIVLGLSRYLEYRIVVVCPKDSEMSSIVFPSNVITKTTNRPIWTMSKKRVWGTLNTVLDFYNTISPFLGYDTLAITNQPVTSSLLTLMPSKHIREIYINRGGDFKDGGLATRIITKKLRNKYIDFAVGISKKQTDLLISCGMPEDRVSLIHNGLPLPSCEYSYRELSSNCLRISTIGFISDLKNQIEGIRLIKLLRDQGINASLNMYGDPDSNLGYQNKIAQEINELKVAPYINYCGFVSGEDLFAETDILISFSRTEGFGRSLVEGMLRKKPIIAWRGAGGPVDITDNGKYGHLVENNEAIAYLSVIKSLLNDPSKNKENVEEAYKFACSHFTTDSMVKKYVNLINNAYNT